MSRSCGSRVVVVVALFLAAGCQNYNFNPVGHCIVQPGSKTETLQNISTADVLFVIDDSGSMAGEQKKLAANFSSFINNLTASNTARAASGLKPLDFHIAVTTTSSFVNYSPSSGTPNPQWTCAASCGSSGQVCCKADGTTPGLGPKRCTTLGASCGSGVSCRNDCTYKDGLSGEWLHLYGELYCCNDTPTAVTFPTGATTSVTENLQLANLTETIPCSKVGSICGTSQQHFAFGLAQNATSPTQYACTPGVSYDGTLFPRGNFVGWANAATNPTAANPRVLHFDTSLYPDPPSSTATNRQGFTSAQLQTFFAGAGGNGVNANVVVGTCGSNEEQGLEAARLAVSRAIAGQQMDTYPATSGTMSATAAEWPHAGSKMLLVFVGDEDDCSSPNDPSGGIVMLPEFAGNDACTRNDGGKQYDIASRYASYFMSLGHPVGAAFIVSSAESICGRPDPAYGNAVNPCTSGKCCQPDCPSSGTCGGGNGSFPQYGGDPYYCGGQAAGTRFFAAASAMKTAGADVFQGSVCDPQFGILLDKIAEIVKPVTGLELPSLPADGVITVLRIADSSGNTVKVCGRPALAGTTPTDAGASSDWWFTATKDGSGNAVAVSKFVYINPKGHCLANPGETYSAEYLGKMPSVGQSGCGATTGDTTGDTMCRQQLGGQLVNGEEPWTCYVPGTTGACGTATFDTVTKIGTGTCLCGTRSQQCK